MPTTDPAKYLPIGVQKSYFLLPKAERAILNSALEQYKPGESDPILIGKNGLLKTALRLMSAHLIKIEETDNAETVYTRWIESVLVRGENQDVYVTFSPRFKRIWTQAKKRMPDHAGQNPAKIGLRSKYAVSLYGWAKKHASTGTKRITLDDVRKLLRLESVKDAAGNLIREAPLPIWANLRQRALDTAIGDINKKTDLHIEIESLEKLGNRVNALNFSVKTQKPPKAGRPPTETEEIHRTFARVSRADESKARRFKADRWRHKQCRPEWMVHRRSIDHSLRRFPPVSRLARVVTETIFFAHLKRPPESVFTHKGDQHA